jgi:hypothetical protein
MLLKLLSKYAVTTPEFMHEMAGFKRVVPLR